MRKSIWLICLAVVLVFFVLPFKIAQRRERAERRGKIELRDEKLMDLKAQPKQVQQIRKGKEEVLEEQALEEEEEEEKQE